MPADQAIQIVIGPAVPHDAPCCAECYLTSSDPLSAYRMHVICNDTMRAHAHNFQVTLPALTSAARSVCPWGRWEASCSAMSSNGMTCISSSSESVSESEPDLRWCTTLGSCAKLACNMRLNLR